MDVIVLVCSFNYPNIHLILNAENLTIINLKEIVHVTRSYLHTLILQYKMYNTF